MAEPIIVREPLYKEVLWRLPQNVYQRRGSLFIVSGIPGHLKEVLDIAEVAATLQIGDLTVGLPDGLTKGLPIIPDIHLQGLPETGSGSIAKSAKERILATAGAFDLTVLGPSVSKQSETGQLIQELVPRIEKPILLVGDAVEEVTLHLLRIRKAATIFIADIGAIARLMKRSDPQLSGNIVGALYKDFKNELSHLAKNANAHLIALSPEAIVASYSGKLAIVPHLTPDVLANHSTLLTGLVAALITHQPAMAFEAAVISLVALRALAEQKLLDKPRPELLKALPKIMTQLSN